MPKVYGVGTYDFRRHRVAEYPVPVQAAAGGEAVAEVAPPQAPGAALAGSITLSEIQRDRLTKIAAANWAKGGAAAGGREFKPELVREIYETELMVSDGRKTVPLQRVMILEVSQYLENYLWPHFDPETASFEHIMSMVLMVNEKVGLLLGMILIICPCCLNRHTLH